MSEVELRALKEYLNNMLGKGFIRLSISAASALVLFAKKKDGSLRPCVDYLEDPTCTQKSHLKPNAMHSTTEWFWDLITEGIVCVYLNNILIYTKMLEENYTNWGPFNQVMDSVNNNLGKMIFVHSPGGCGKTFVCNTLASAVQSNRDVALCVALSGIAALLLEGGRTAHSRFKIPIPALDTSIANIKRGTQLL
ncbi:hypothetical protein J132_05050 [Termitomyces sp. J132]|nr:hypothetical protein J132_05050 [Termitomyces sp. J132]